MKGVIWDWNGTLLNDIEAGVSGMNLMLEKRGMEKITADYYREIFDFPVINFYQKLGFDVENNWETLSLEFIENYYKIMKDCTLFDEIKGILSELENRGTKLFILSAMEHHKLQKNVSDLGIYSHFRHVEGIEDYNAHGKIDKGEMLLEKCGIEPEHLVMIGDTTHDHEVAEHLGCSSILISRGHQSWKRLKKTGTTVLQHHRELVNTIFDQ